MAWKQYILQKKQISTDAGITWHDAEPYVTRVGDPVAIFDSYEECMNMLYRWIPTDIEYCDYKVDENTKMVFGYSFESLYNPYDSGLTSSILYHEGIEKDGTSGDSIVTRNEVSSFKDNCLEIKIFEGATEIENNAFFTWHSVKNIELPSTLTYIGYGAFGSITGITSIEIPNNVTEIGQDAFEFCNQLTDITFGSGLATIGYGAFRHCINLKEVYIPDNVTSIYNYAFGDCSGLTSVRLSKNIYNLMGFTNCISLTSVDIPNGIVNISYDAFKGCSGLTSVTIPESVTGFHWNAFMDCISLSSVTLPSSVYYIGKNAFSGCSGLNSITVEAISPPYLELDDQGNYTQFNNTNNCPIYVPSNSINIYKTADGWSTYTDRLVAIT